MTTELKRIAYLGISGSYSHQACVECFPEAQYRGFSIFEEAFTALEQGDVDYAIVPIENSTAGRVFEVYNRLPATKLWIIGEFILPIHHCLMVPRKAFRQNLPLDIPEEEVLAWKSSGFNYQERQIAFASIREVHTHPQAIMQCRAYIRKYLPNARLVEVTDTATAARSLSARTDCKIAAIGSALAGSIYDIEVLTDSIEDSPNNATRFLTFSRAPVVADELAGPTITSICFCTGHQPGSLAAALKIFADHNLNITKLETYMVDRHGGLPTFYIDIGSVTGAVDVEAALVSVRKCCASFTLLGTYPASAARRSGLGFLAVEPE